MRSLSTAHSERAARPHRHGKTESIEKCRFLIADSEFQFPGASVRTSAGRGALGSMPYFFIPALVIALPLISGRRKLS